MSDGSALVLLAEQLMLSKNLFMLKRVVMKSQREKTDHKSLEMSLIAFALSLT